VLLRQLLGKPAIEEATQTHHLYALRYTLRSYKIQLIDTSISSQNGLLPLGTRYINNNNGLIIFDLENF